MPVAPIVFMGVGGLMLFFALFFGLIASIAEPGFGTVALIVGGFAVILIVGGWFMYWRYKRKLERERRLALERYRCRYCDAQNEIGAQRCFSCGAPFVK